MPRSLIREPLSWRYTVSRCLPLPGVCILGGTSRCSLDPASRTTSATLVNCGRADNAPTQASSPDPDEKLGLARIRPTRRVWVLCCRPRCCVTSAHAAGVSRRDPPNAIELESLSSALHFVMGFS